MTSYDERRRVSERLRGLNGNASRVRRAYEVEGISIVCDDQADYYQICNAIAGYLPAEHMHPCDYDELHLRLADLIEPSCDRDALLALADELETQQANKGIRQICPYMQPGEAARRIREACGEAVDGC